MKSIDGSYKVIRVQPDGQKVSVGAFSNVREAKRVIAALSEYWPGDYRILQPPLHDKTAEALYFATHGTDVCA
jgi:hypothetical protein